MRICVLVALLVALSGGVADAAAAVNPCTMQRDRNHLVADATRPGVIELRFYNADGARVTFFECAGDRPRRLGSRLVAPDPRTNPPTTLADAATWSCDRLVRRFAALATLPGGRLASGAYSVRTVSCAQRFSLDVPARVRPRARVRVRIVDRWRIGGIRARLCVAPPGALRACRTLAFPRAVAVATRGFRAGARGRWRVELRVAGHRVRRAVTVGAGPGERPPAPPVVLATGDSTMQGIDSFLSDELGDAAVVQSDVRPGSGISRGDFWPRHAAAQAKRLRPAFTVISVGAATDNVALPAADGTVVACCGAPWVLAYATRVRAMMRAYLRHGRARVVWLTPPLPRYRERAQITAAVNAAVTMAAAGLRGVGVGRVDRFFAPGGGYRDVMRYRGRDVRVRESDGIHLSIAGTAIVAELLAPQIADALAQLP